VYNMPAGNFEIYDYNKKHKDQYGKVLFWNVSDNKWYLDKAHTKIAKYQEDLSMPYLLETRNNPLYPSTLDADPSTLGIQPFTESNYKPQHWTSKNGMQSYTTTSEGNWIGINFDETNPDHGYAQNWNIETSRWEINGKPLTYQMQPPPMLKYEKPKTVNPPKPPQSSPSITSGSEHRPKSGTTRTYSGSTKSKITPGRDKVIKEKPAQYDLLFNSLAYMNTLESLTEEIGMDLIASGDDLLTNFNYMSVDYLPDFDVQTKDKYNDYVDAVDLLKQTEIYDTEANKTIGSSLADPILLDNVIDDLIEELKNNLQGKTFSQTIKYFGTIKTPDGFNSGFSKGSKVDFRYPLSKKYDKYDIVIDFNPI